MMNLKQLSFCAFGFLLFSSQAHAVINVNVEPIIGYERVQQVLPTPHTVNRLTYGARVSAGVLMLSAEAEYTRSNIQETFTGMTQSTDGQRLKLGLRSGFRVGPILSISLRGGAQASQETYNQTVSGVTTSFVRNFQYNPYAGLSVRASLFSKFTATADVVAVVPDFRDMNQNEYQVTAGFGIRLP